MSLYAEVIEEITGDGRWVGFHPPSVTGLWKTSKPLLDAVYVKMLEKEQFCSSSENS